jgi:hypothetical protein
MTDHGRGNAPDEIALLRRAVEEAGLDPSAAPERFGISLDSPDEMLARVKGERDDLPAKWRWRRGVVLAAGAVAAAAALVLGLVQPWHSSPAAATPPPILDFEFANAANIAYAPGKDATAELQRLARIAAKSRPPAGSGRVQHIVTDNYFESIEGDKETTKTVLIPQILQLSLRPDGSVKTIQRDGAPLSPSGRGLPKHGEWDKSPRLSGDNLPADSMDPEFAANLPHDVPGLRAALLKDAYCHSTKLDTVSTNCLFERINAIYTTWIVTPQLSSRMWTLLSTESGVRLLGSVTDRAGRSGVGISLIASNEPQTRHILIVSPTTGQLLGSEDILIKTTSKSDVKAPAIATFTAILDARYVKH